MLSKAMWKKPKGLVIGIVSVGSNPERGLYNPHWVVCFALSEEQAKLKQFYKYSGRTFPTFRTEHDAIAYLVKKAAKNNWEEFSVKKE